jgi:hypothetical protein
VIARIMTLVIANRMPIADGIRSLYSLFNYRKLD